MTSVESYLFLGETLNKLEATCRQEEPHIAPMAGRRRFEVIGSEIGLGIIGLVGGGRSGCIQPAGVVCAHRAHSGNGEGLHEVTGVKGTNLELLRQALAKEEVREKQLNCS